MKNQNNHKKPHFMNGYFVLFESERFKKVILKHYSLRKFATLIAPEWSETHSYIVFTAGRLPREKWLKCVELLPQLAYVKIKDVVYEGKEYRKPLRS